MARVRDDLGKSLVVAARMAQQAEREANHASKGLVARERELADQVEVNDGGAEVTRRVLEIERRHHDHLVGQAKALRRVAEGKAPYEG